MAALLPGPPMAVAVGSLRAPRPRCLGLPEGPLPRKEDTPSGVLSAGSEPSFLSGTCRLPCLFVRPRKAEREGRRLLDKCLRRFPGTLRSGLGGQSHRWSPGSGMCPVLVLPVDPAISLWFESVLASGIDTF